MANYRYPSGCLGERPSDGRRGRKGRGRAGKVFDPGGAWAASDGGHIPYGWISQYSSNPRLMEISGKGSRATLTAELDQRPPAGLASSLGQLRPPRWKTRAAESK